MVKPSHTDARDYSNDSVVLSRASALLDELARGVPVPPARVAEARGTLLDLLLLDRPATRGTAERGLLTIYASSGDDADRAQMIGDFYAAGPRGQTLLARLLDGDSSTNLSRDELAELRDTAGLPIRDRLQYIAGKLEAERDQPQPERVPIEGGPEPSGAAIVPNRESRTTRAGRTHSSGGAPPDSKAAIAALEDRTISNEARHERAMELGSRAVPVLGRMLIRDDGEREFALATLVELGKQRAVARDVHLEMQRIEAIDGGGGRRAAELVRHAIERGDDEPFDPRARERLRGAAVQDGWLSSTLERCDKTSILKAAAGRETLAIALGVRKLHELRARRR